ncbi:unnamed protein product, partial [Adineta ricciae]
MRHDAIVEKNEEKRTCLKTIEYYDDKVKKM